MANNLNSIVFWNNDSKKFAFLRENCFKQVVNCVFFWENIIAIGAIL